MHRRIWRPTEFPTYWPTIPGSALRGVLRDACRETAKANHGNDRKKANEDVYYQTVATFIDKLLRENPPSSEPDPSDGND